MCARHCPSVLGPRFLTSLTVLSPSSCLKHRLIRWQATSTLRQASLPQSPLLSFQLSQTQVNKVAGSFHFAPGRSYQQGNMRP